MTVYHQQPKYSHRPYNFRRVLDHPLWDGCVFAGLGNASSSKVWDSSPAGNHADYVGDNLSVQSERLSVNGRLYFVSPVSSGRLTQVQLPTSPLNGATKFSLSWWHQTDPWNNNPIFNSWSEQILVRNYYDDFRIQVKTDSGEHGGTLGPCDQGKFSHYAIVYDGAEIRGYLDGVQAPNTRTANGTVVNTANPFYAYNGYIASAQHVADPIIWTRALTASETLSVSDVMLDGAIEPIPTTTYFLPKEEPTPTEGALVPYHHQPKFSHRPYNFRRVLDHPLWDGCVFAGLGNVGDGLYYEDSSISRIDCTPENVTASSGWRSSIGRQSFNLSGAANERITLDPQPFSGSVPRTFAAWVKPVSSGTNSAIYATGTGTTGAKWQVRTIGGVLRIEVSGGGMNFNLLPTIDGGQWTFVAVTSKGEDLIDHVGYVGTESRPSTVARALNTGIRLTSLGWADTDGGREWAGEIADPIIWTKELSAAELAAFADPTNFMLDGAIEPISTTSYFVSTGEPPPQPELLTDIFTSAVIGV